MQGDSAMVNDLLQVFLQLAPECLERLETAADQADGTPLLPKGRTLPPLPISSPLAVSPNGAQRIEQAAARGDFDTVKQDLETLRQEIRSLEALTTESRASA